MFGTGFGFVELFFGSVLLAFVVGLVIVVRVLWRQWRMARVFGYPSLNAYLRAAPRTDEERKAAADMALVGLVVCLLGVMFPPLLLVGLFPFFYGSRKLLYASLGLGLADDAEGTPPDA